MKNEDKYKFLTNFIIGTMFFCLLSAFLVAFIDIKLSDLFFMLAWLYIGIARLIRIRYKNDNILLSGEELFLMGTYFFIAFYYLARYFFITDPVTRLISLVCVVGTLIVIQLFYMTVHFKMISPMIDYQFYKIENKFLKKMLTRLSDDSKVLLKSIHKLQKGDKVWSKQQSEKKKYCIAKSATKK
jgi:hypothetical protein